MKRPLLAGAALGVIAFLAPQVAFADCEARLAEAAAAVGTLPYGTDYRVQDQLNELYAEAEGLMETDAAGCLSAVQRMEELVRRNGGSVGAKGESGLMQTADKGDAAGSGSAFQPASAGGNGGSGRQGFVPISPTSSGDMESRMAGLGPERQREVRAADNYARATHALGSSIVDGAATPSDGVNRLAAATNEAVEMAEAARDAMIADSSRFSTMVQNLLERLADSKQAFETAMNSPQAQAALASATDAQIDTIRAAYVEAAQATAVLDQRAREIESANISEGMAPGFEAAWRAMARRHENELRGPIETWEIKNNEHSAAVGSMDRGRANLAYGEVQAANNRLIVIRNRHNDEYDALLRQYSTMVIDLTQPDGRPRSEGHRPPVAEGRPRGPAAGSTNLGQSDADAENEMTDREIARRKDELDQERRDREATNDPRPLPNWSDEDLQRSKEILEDGGLEAGARERASIEEINAEIARRQLAAEAAGWSDDKLGEQRLLGVLSDAATQRMRDAVIDAEIARRRAVADAPNHTPADATSRSASERGQDTTAAPNHTPGELSNAPAERNHTPGARPDDPVIAPLRSTNPQYGPEHRPDQVNGPPKDDLLAPLTRETPPAPAPGREGRNPAP